MDEDLITAELLGLIKRGPVLGGAVLHHNFGIAPDTIVYYLETTPVSALWAPEGDSRADVVHGHKQRIHKALLAHWGTGTTFATAFSEAF